MKQEFTRIAVKVGSNVLTRRDGTLDVTRMSALVDQIAELHKSGVEIILISSGAVASGRSEVHPQKKLDSVDQRQLFSAVGQAKLINRYYELFREHSIPVGQVLTTKESFGTRRHYLNQKNCMTVMLENNVIPIVNENDTISVSITESERLYMPIETMKFEEKHATSWELANDYADTYNSTDNDSVNDSEYDYNSSDSYILSDSSSRELTIADISGLSHDQLELARNEIYARHGRKFTNPTLQNYFDSQAWYTGTIEPEDFTDDMLSDIEKSNIQFIKDHE